MRLVQLIGGLAVALVFFVGGGEARAQDGSYVINLRDAEIQVLAEQVSAITDRTLILDPAVRGTVTVISSEPLRPAGVWELFQAVLRTQGFAALQSGEVWRVVPQAAVPGGAALGRAGGLGSQDFVTQLIRLQNLPPDAAAQVLRPLVADYGTLEALPDTNAIVVTDTAENVVRIERLARSLDQQEGASVTAISLDYAGAAEVARSIQQIIGEEEGFGPAPRIAVDERSNILLIRGDAEALRTARRIASTLDQPGGVAPTTKVFRLQHGDAEMVAQILQGLIGAPGAVTNPVARTLSAANETGLGQQLGAGPTNTVGNELTEALGIPAAVTAPDVTVVTGVGEVATGGVGGFSAANVAIQPAPALNAIAVRGPPGAIAEIGALIAELDQRRPQVLIEAAIVEITGDVAEALGVQFGLGAEVSDGTIAGTAFSTVGASLRSILTALGAPAAVPLLEGGLSVAVTPLDDFSILVQALAQSSKANLLSTPSLTTLDNQPAEIVVGQNVPFRTGTFSPSGNSDDPFTTIEREDVGITLRVVPRVHQGDTIRLEVSQEASSLVNATIAGAADLITNRRSIQTTVLADNGETIVLGGLITDNRLEAEGKVPILGDIPVAGRLFRAERQNRTKQTLFVFLRPTVLRDRVDVARASRRKYDVLRGAEVDPVDRESLLFGAELPPKLPLEIEGIY